MFEFLALPPTPPAVVAQLAAPAFDTREAGRQCSALFFAQDAEALWARLGPEMRKAFKTREALAAFQVESLKTLGKETEVLDEIVTPLMNFSVYMRTVKTQRWPASVNLTWSFDAEGRVAGFQVVPKKEPAASRFLDYRTKTAMQLPFKGEWAVVWGGRTVEQNYHAMARDQRFAYDLLVIKEGKTHSGDGTKNEQFYAYNQPILAPGAGVVVTAVDGVSDNQPGKMNPDAAPGNHVVIDHGNGEFSLLAHLKPGSLKVKPGQRVKAGELLGLCGNSGNSSEAHLHYHLQNAPGFGQGEGLPVQFRAYRAGGKPVALGEPTQGQTLQP